MRALIIIAALATGLAPLSSCGSSEDSKDSSKSEEKSFSDRAKSFGDSVSDKAKNLGDKAVDEAKDLGDKAADEAAKLKDLATGGAGDALTAITPYVDDAKGGIESAIVKGKQVGDKVEAVTDVVGPLLSDGVILKPIFQRVDDPKAAAELDAAIKGMPRVEVIDGITIGFRAHSKRQYLVTWRKGNYLIGFVYTSVIDVAIGELVKRMPQIIAVIAKLS